MRTSIVTVAVVCGCLIAGGFPLTSTRSDIEAAEAAKGSAAVERATGLALQGDAASAARVLIGTSTDAFTGEDASFRTCMIERFGPAAHSSIDVNASDEWISRLANAYVAYWHEALMRPAGRDEAERNLTKKIAELLGHAVPKDAGIDAVEDEIKADALKRGFYVLLGRTQPLLDLMIWKKQTTENRKVELPEGSENVTITFLNDFVLRGWGYYATCTRRSTGGWATENGLFAVVPAYKSLKDEVFSVRFVAHETQHFADKRTFPNLESWELEYRAKLVELALADSSQESTLQRICENRSEKKDSSHAFADFHVIADLGTRLGVASDDICENRKVTGQPVRDAARQVLFEDSRKRREQSTGSKVAARALLIPKGRPVRVDGRADAEEWDDARLVEIAIRADWHIQVRLKHDDANLYFIFEGLKNGTNRLFPEILLDPGNLKSSDWRKGHWWFHVSANLCEGNGEPNVYQKDGIFQCAHEKPGWEGNNPPTPQTNIVEIRVSYAKVGINNPSSEPFGLAFGLTDATGDKAQKWYWWPKSANISNPRSWGEAILN